MEAGEEMKKTEGEEEDVRLNAGGGRRLMEIRGSVGVLSALQRL